MGAFDHLIPGSDQGGNKSESTPGAFDHLIPNDGQAAPAATAPKAAERKPITLADRAAGQEWAWGKVKQGVRTLGEAVGVVEPQAGAGRGNVNPTPVDPSAPTPKQPAPYRDRREALDDAVNLLEEGADIGRVAESFAQLGINRDEIERHGAQRGSPLFQQRQSITPQEAQRAASAVAPTGSISASPGPRDRTVGEIVSDAGQQLKAGTYNVIGAPFSLVDPSGDMAQHARMRAAQADKAQSAPMRQRIAMADAAIDEAGQDGVVSQIAEAASQYFTDPALAARFVIANLPSMVPSIAAAKVAQGASLARGMTAAAAARNATVAAGGVNAALNAGGARGEAFEDIKRTLMAQGMDERQATDTALQDSRVVAAVGAAAGALSGASGLEGAIAKQGAGALVGGGVRAGARSAGVELLGEQVEEVAPKVATNMMAGQYDNRPVTQDVGRTIVETAIGSAPGAALAGVTEGMNDPAREIAGQIDGSVPQVLPRPEMQRDPMQAWEIARSKGFLVDVPMPTDRPSVRRSKSVEMFKELGSMFGIPQGPMKLAIDFAEKVPADRLPDFFARYAEALQKRGLVGTELDPDVLAAMRQPMVSAAPQAVAAGAQPEAVDALAVGAQGDQMAGLQSEGLPAAPAAFSPVEQDAQQTAPEVFQQPPTPGQGAQNLQQSAPPVQQADAIAAVPQGSLAAQLDATGLAEDVQSDRTNRARLPEESIASTTSGMGNVSDEQGSSTRVQGLVHDAPAVPQPSRLSLQELRGEGNSGLQVMEGEFRGIPGGRGEAPFTTSLSRPGQQRLRLQPGEREVGDHGGAKPQQAEQSLAGAQRGSVGDEGLGRPARDFSFDASGKNQSLGSGGGTLDAKGSNTAGRGVRISERQEGAIGDVSQAGGAASQVGDSEATQRDGPGGGLIKADRVASEERGNDHRAREDSISGRMGEGVWPSAQVDQGSYPEGLVSRSSSSGQAQGKADSVPQGRLNEPQPPQAQPASTAVQADQAPADPGRTAEAGAGEAGRGVPGAGAAATAEAPGVKAGGSFEPVTKFDNVNVGPGGFIQPRPIAPGQNTYRETGLDGLNQVMREDRQAVPFNGFVADTPDLAIGQYGNKGVHLVFRPDSVGGREHAKPGTGDQAGREYRTELLAPKAVQTITMDAADVPKLSKLARMRLQEQFEREEISGGRARFHRKGLEKLSPPDPVGYVPPKPKGAQRGRQQVEADTDRGAAPAPYADGDLLPADEMLAFFDAEISGAGKGTKVPNPRFEVGTVDDQAAQEIAAYISGYDGTQRRLRVSGRTLKHIHESRPSIARQIVEGLPGMFVKPDEVLPDHKHPGKRALLIKAQQSAPGDSKNRSNVATVEIEVQVSDGFIDIVTVMTAPERSLKAARELKKGWSEGQQRAEQAANSPHPLPAEAVSPAADFPDARPAKTSVSQTGQGDKPAQGAASTAGTRVIGRAGRTPNSAQNIELRENADGTATPWSDGYELVNFETGEPIVLARDVSDQDAVEAIKSAGALGRGVKIYAAKQDDSQFSVAADMGPGPYTDLSTQINSSPMNAGTAGAWRQYLDTRIGRGLIKAEDVDQSGLREWLAQQTGKVSKGDIKALLDQAEQRLPLFSRGAADGVGAGVGGGSGIPGILGIGAKPTFASGANRPTVSRVDLDKLIVRNADNWAGIGLDRLIAVDSWAELPDQVLSDARKKGFHPGLIEGVVHRNRVYLVRSALRNVDHAERVLFHEAYGHMGTRIALEGKPTEALNALWDKLNGLAGVAKLAKKHQVGDGMTAWDRLQPYIQGTQESVIDRRAKIVDELIAFLAQANDTSALTQFKTYLADLKGAMVALARRLGLNGLADRLDRAGAEMDVLQLVRDARRAVRTGTSRQGSLVVFGADPAAAFSEGDAMSREATAPEETTSEAADPAFSLSPDDQDPLRRAMAKAGLRKTSGITGRAKDLLASAAANAVAMVQDRNAIANSARQNILDQFAGIDVAVRREVGNLPVEQDPYITARLANGGTSSVMRALLMNGKAKWAANGQHLEKVEGSKGLLDILAPLGDDLNDWFAWMIGNRAARLSKEGRENLFSPEEISAMQQLDKGRKELFAKTAMQYADFKKSVLDVAERAGLLDADARKAWDHADYIPFYRQIDDRAAFSPTGRGGLAGQSSGVRTLKGGTAALNDPMENLLMNFSRLIDASLKNNAMLKTIDTLGGKSDIVTKVGYEMSSELIPKDQIRKMLMQGGASEHAMSVLPDSVFDGMAKMWAIKPPGDPDVIRVMRNGKPEYYRVSDPLLLKAVTSFVPVDFTGLDLMRWFKRTLTHAVTSTPEFMLRNYIRDTLSSAMISRDEFNLSNSLKGIAESYTGSGASEAMMFAGASFQSGVVNASDPTATAIAMRRALRKRGMNATAVNSFMGTILDNGLGAWERYREAGEAIENANREAVYKAAIGAGRSDTAAAFEAKDLMDFSLRGSHPVYQVMADTLPFFNARVQGLYRLGRADPQRIMKYGTVLMAASLMLAALNAGEDWYEELPDWDKDTFWHIRVGGHHFRIPKPFELGVIFATIPERMMRFMTGQDAGGKTADRVWANVRDQLAFDFVPHIFRPALDVYSNHDSFRDSPIETLGDERKLPHLRASARTSDTMKALTAAMPGVSDTTGLSPKRLEFLVGGYFGTVGLYALGLSDIAVRALDSDAAPRPARRLDDYPVIKAFYREDPARSTVFESDFYKVRKEVEQVYASVNQLRKDGDRKQARELAEDKKDLLAARSAVQRAAKELTNLNKQRDAIYKSMTLTPEQKRLRLDALQLRRNALTKRVMSNPAVKEAAY